MKYTKNVELLSGGNVSRSAKVVFITHSPQIHIPVFKDVHLYIYVYTYDAIGTQHKYYTVDKLTYKLGGGLFSPPNWVGGTRCLQISEYVCHKACLSLVNRVKEAQPNDLFSLRHSFKV